MPSAQCQGASCTHRSPSLASPAPSCCVFPSRAPAITARLPGLEPHQGRGLETMDLKKKTAPLGPQVYMSTQSEPCVGWMHAAGEQSHSLSPRWGGTQLGVCCYRQIPELGRGPLLGHQTYPVNQPWHWAASLAPTPSQETSLRLSMINPSFPRPTLNSSRWL